MSRRRHTPEQIITALREAEVGLELSRFGGRVNTEVGIATVSWTPRSRCVKPPRRLRD